ncbi:MAG: TerC/Alx family metal homeostasis membrane protein [Solirubrobacterales bacterium]
MNDLVAVAALTLCLFAFLWIDLRLFAQGREPSFREGLVWSIGWLVVSLLAALVVWAIEGPDDAVLYTTVYLVERSLSLDNLFVFLLLFRYFAVPVPERARLLFWGIVAALALRGLAILGGVALIEEFHFVVYVLGVTLLVLAYRVYRGVAEGVDPANNLFVRGVRRVFPVSDSYHGKGWFLRIGGRMHTTPLFLCLAAIVFADIAFAIDSIPAAFGITRDPLLIWMGNVFALLGLRALFVLVEGLIGRFRYLDETIAIVLGVVAVKLLTEDIYKMPPVGSLAIVLGLLAGGMIVSLIAERRDARRGKPVGAGTPQARLTPDEDPQLRHD